MSHTPAQINDYQIKLKRLKNFLDQKYWPSKPNQGETTVVVGSWLKNTQVRACSDIDIIYLLPYHMRDRFAGRTGPVQSQILQEVRNTLIASYPITEIKSDGPVVVVDLSTIKIEIIPAFLDVNGSPIVSDWDFKIWICHTRNAGYYSLSAPIAETQYFLQIDQQNRGNASALLKMLKVWKRYCNVPVRTITLQMMTEAFVPIWTHRDANHFWPDWLIRDFFQYMTTQVGKRSFFPSTGEPLEFGSTWNNHAISALEISKKACVFEQYSCNEIAGEQWRLLFGPMIQRVV